jgi:hypothetical protein
MSAVPVSVQITGTAADSAYVDQLIRACSEAVPENGCELAADTPANGDIIAIVEWDENHRLARIRVATAEDVSHALERRLEFQESDRESERWRSVGLTIATMVDSLVEPEQPTSSETEVKADQTPPTASIAKAEGPHDVQTTPLRLVPTNVASPQRTILWVDATGVTGPGLDDGFWRWGAQARLSYSPFDSVLVLGTIGYALRQRVQDVSVTWTTAGFGIGYRLQPTTFSELRVHADVVGELVSANVEDSTTGDSDDGHVFDLGVGAGVDGAWNVTHWLGLVVGGDLASTSKATDIRVHDSHLARGGPISYTILAGPRFSLVEAR